MITHFDHVLLYIAMPIVKPEDLKKAYKKVKRFEEGGIDALRDLPEWQAPKGHTQRH